MPKHKYWPMLEVKPRSKTDSYYENSHKMPLFLRPFFFFFFEGSAKSIIADEAAKTQNTICHSTEHSSAAPQVQGLCFPARRPKPGMEPGDMRVAA